MNGSGVGVMIAATTNDPTSAYFQYPRAAVESPRRSLARNTTTIGSSNAAPIQINSVTTKEMYSPMLINGSAMPHRNSTDSAAQRAEDYEPEGDPEQEQEAEALGTTKKRYFFSFPFSPGTTNLISWYTITGIDSASAANRPP